MLTPQQTERRLMQRHLHSKIVQLTSGKVFDTVSQYNLGYTQCSLDILDEINKYTNG